MDVIFVAFFCGSPFFSLFTPTHVPIKGFKVQLGTLLFVPCVV